MAELKLSVMRYTDAAIGRSAAIMVKKPFAGTITFSHHTRLAGEQDRHTVSLLPQAAERKPVYGIPIHLVAAWEVIPERVFPGKIQDHGHHISV